MFYAFCITTWWSSLVCPPHQCNLRQSCHLSRTSAQRRCHLLGYITCWRHCQVWDGEWWPCSWARTPAPGWWWPGLCSMGSHPCQNNLNTHSCLWLPSLPPAVQPTLGSYLHHALPLIDIRGALSMWHAVVWTDIYSLSIIISVKYCTSVYCRLSLL